MAHASRGRPLPFQRVAMLAMPLLLGACAHTTATLEPGPQVPVCSPAASALILWAPVWRPDQKDVASREAAAALGLEHFFAQPGCFASTALQRVVDLTPPSVAAALASTPSGVTRVVGIEVHELGPVVKLLSSVALVEGGTEVVLRIAEYAPRSGAELRGFQVHWRHGGAGVIQGVASLPQDMQAALRAGLKPDAAAR